MRGESGDSRYWDGVASRSNGHYLPPALSEHKIGEYRRLLDGWGIGPCRRALVTDLYDSAFGASGLVGLLTGRAEEVYCLDISPAFCRMAGDVLRGLGHGAKPVAGDARGIPLAENSVDLVLSPSTFDHFPEIGSALAECRRVLRPGGRLLLALNSAENPLYKLGVRLAERFKRHDYPTDYFYTSRQAKDLLAAAGFRAGRTAAIMQVPLGATTIIELIGGSRNRLSALTARVLMGLCRRLGKSGGGWSRMTGWWVVAEGIK